MTFKNIVLSLVISLIAAAIYDLGRTYMGASVELLFYVFNSIEKSLYSQISLGYTERYSLFIFIFIYTLPVCLYVFVILHITVDKISKNNGRNIKTKDSKNKETFIVVLSILSVFYLLYQVNSAIYINDKITCFTHKSNILAPFMNEYERLKIKSDFSRIQYKKDYDKIIEEFETLSQKNNLEIREIQKCRELDLLFNVNGY